MHRIREAIAGGIIDFGHIGSDENLADICTKPLGPTKFHALTGKYMFRKSTALEKAKDKAE